MGAIKNREIKFNNNVIDSVITKSATSANNDPDIGFISQFKNAKTLADIIADVDKAINGDFNSIDDPDVSNNIDIAFISPTGVDFYDRSGQDIIGTISLQDFKELAEAWRAFLLEPPLNGTKQNLFNKFLSLLL